VGYTDDMGVAAPRTVLVVDDEPDVVTLVRLLIRDIPDLDVVAEAVDGHEALEMFDQLDGPPVPHVVVLDSQMPGMKGMEVARLMRERVRGQRVVLFTAVVNERIREEARRAGIDEVVAKTEFKRLVEVLRSI
jgi:CheY-like chemotaxis protein